MGRVILDAKTGPCPRCKSFDTRVAGSADGTVIYLRYCRSCNHRWDYQPEFAPRRRRRSHATQS